MTLIHTHIPKRKKRKPTAKQRQLQASWEEILKKYEPKKTPNRTKTKQAMAVTQPVPYRRETQHIESHVTSGKADCSKPVSRSYTGSAIVGIATMHKSNAVPVFSTEEAVEISKMRRG